MKTAFTTLAMWLLLAIGGAAFAADPLTLVKDGASDYTIVVAANASPSDQWAAEELANHLKQISGAELKAPAPGDGEGDGQQRITFTRNKGSAGGH